MNKRKAEFNPFIALLLWAVVCLLLVVVVVMDNEIHNSKENKACEEIGLKERFVVNGISYCRDKDNNLHYVYFDCSGFLINVECKADIITIGNNRIEDSTKDNRVIEIRGTK